MSGNRLGAPSADGEVSASGAEAALEAGMNDLLAKPFGLPDLERLLIRWTRARDFDV